jgi:acetyl esterase/lipase
MRIILALTIIFLFIMNTNLFSQPKIMNVWSGKIPGSIQSPGFKNEDTIILEKGKIRIARVTNPTLAVYFPKKKSNGIAVVICPGGGYTRLAMDNEGSDIAHWFNSFGVTAVVLKYRLPNDTIMENKSIGPLQDVQEAIRILRRNAKEWKLNPDKIGVIGFSAGGHLASTISTHFNDKVYDSDSISARPDFSILIYPVISMSESKTHAGSRYNLLGKTPDNKLVEYFSNELRVTKNTPPTFIVHAEDDKTVPVQNSIDYFTSLKSRNIPAELHIYQKGGHGFGLAKDKGTAALWPDACIKWLKEIDMIK